MRKYFTVVAILSWILMTAMSSAPMVTVHSGKLSVKVKDIPLSEILSAIRTQSKIEISMIGKGEFSEIKITEDFKDLPVAQGIVRLLRGLSYSIITEPRTRVLKRVLILGRGATGSDISADTSHLDLAGGQNEVNRSLVPQTSLEASAPPLADDSIAKAVNAAKAAQDPQERVEALVKLGDFQDSRTLDALQPALESNNEEVRKAALEAMRWGTVHEPSALEDVRRLAYQDPDPDVVRLALEVIVRYDTTVEGRELLERLTESEEVDDGTRAFAKKHLQRMDEEASASVNDENELIQ